jgi:uncharacterized delta-60 repeat protein
MGSIRGGVGRAASVLSAAVIVLGGQGVAIAGGVPGHLDPMFNGTGRAQIGFGGQTAEAHAVAMQGRKIVVVGAVGLEADEDMAVVRLTADGALDRTFGGGDGRFVRNFFGDADLANAVAVLPDDRILVAGQGYDPVSKTGRFVVLRLTPDGRLDHTFGGGDGIVVTKFAPGGAFGLAMTVLPDGRFVVCGSYAGVTSGFALVRYRANGGLDPSFGSSGRVVTNFPGQQEAICTAVTLVGAKVMAVGTVWDGSTYSFAAARYRRDGMPDPTFDGDGLATFAPAVSNRATGVVALPDDKAVLAGSVSDGVNPPDVALLRLTPTGTLDPSFGGGDGIVIDDLGSADQSGGIVRQGDGRLILVGFRNPDMFVARYKPLGTRDAGFAKDGVQSSPWSLGASTASAAVLAGGQVVVVGNVRPGPHSRFAVERLFR